MKENESRYARCARPVSAEIVGWFWRT